MMEAPEKENNYRNLANVPVPNWRILEFFSDSEKTGAAWWNPQVWFTIEQLQL